LSLLLIIWLPTACNDNAAPWSLQHYCSSWTAKIGDFRGKIGKIQ
jgi:hypothetical protein